MIDEVQESINKFTAPNAKFFSFSDDSLENPEFNGAVERHPSILVDFALIGFGSHGFLRFGLNNIFIILIPPTISNIIMKEENGRDYF